MSIYSNPNITKYSLNLSGLKNKAKKMTLARFFSFTPILIFLIFFFHLYISCDYFLHFLTSFVLCYRLTLSTPLLMLVPSMATMNQMPRHWEPWVVANWSTLSIVVWFTCQQTVTLAERLPASKVETSEPQRTWAWPVSTQSFSASTTESPEDWLPWKQPGAMRLFTRRPEELSSLFCSTLFMISLCLRLLETKEVRHTELCPLQLAFLLDIIRVLTPSCITSSLLLQWDMDVSFKSKCESI